MNTIGVHRVLRDHSATFGVMSFNGRYICNTIEDTYRAGPVKVPGKTRIPEGTYRVTLRTVGGFHSRYSARFPTMHRGMLWIRDVPNFKYILIHIGNTADDSAGCILVGEAPPAFLNTFRVNRSTDTYKAIYPELAKHAARGELQISIKDCDHGE